MTQNRWVVQSESDSKKTYEVVRIGDKFVCSCPDAMYRDRECKHCRMIRAMLKEEEKEKEKNE